MSKIELLALKQEIKDEITNIKIKELEKDKQIKILKESKSNYFDLELELAEISNIKRKLYAQLEATDILLERF